MEHPMGPGRVRNTVSLAAHLGVLDRLEVVPPPETDLDLIRSVHHDHYIEAVCAEQADLAHGLGTSDNPVVPGMHAVAAQVAMASVEAARSVWSEESLRASNISGGLHHAMPGQMSGFCVYNDIAVAIRWLLDQGCQRVAYVDVDVHHGDGVQDIFYDDPRVLTVSLHETPVCLFPGTGYPTETGGPAAPGSAVNVALPPGTNDAGWLRAFHAVVPEAVRAHRPQVLLTQHGCDTHQDDPLGDLDLSVDGQRASYLALADLADEVCEGRWVSFGGGGYSVTDVVPRAWSHLLGIVSGEPVPPGAAVPPAWREEIGDHAPRWMSDGRTAAYVGIENGITPESRLDQAILATRRAAFPELGLDPEPH